MLVPVVLATVCLAGSTVLAAYDKPFYEVEDAENLFKEYLKEHNKVYSRREYFERLEIFKATLQDINDRNDKYPNTVFAVNRFADLKPHELQQYRGFKVSNETIRKLEIPDGWISDSDSFDWTEHNAVTPVKDQGQCKCCFIFGAVGEIEGQYAIKYQQCLAFSEGQALDCLSAGSCSGGDMVEVMKELASRNMKLEKEDDYTYKPEKSTCSYDPNKGVVQVLGGERSQEMDEEKLKALLHSHGPISIAINANDFNSYHGGILEPTSCTNQPIDHAVLLVGYGEENGIKFWKIKNSWGTATWGESGYVRMLRGVNACGLGTELALSTVA